MRNETALSTALVRKLNANFFDVSEEGILVYLDPMIGPLRNRSRQLLVSLNAKKKQFELRLQGRVAEVFDFEGNMGNVCCRAFGAYFQAFEQLCHAQNRTNVAGRYDG